MLPFDYAVRNLGRSPSRLLMSVLGAALVVLLIVAAGAFIRGMEKSLAQSSSAANVMLLGAGSEESIERSEISPSVPGQLSASIRGIRSVAGADFVSPEVHAALGVALAPNTASTAQGIFRGVTPAAFLVHPQVHITDGRIFRPGEDELIVGALAATRLGVEDAALDIGHTLWLDERALTVVGRFEAPGTVMDAEIWCAVSNLQMITRRDTLSCVVATLDTAEFPDVDAFAATRLDLELVAIREADYYQKLQAFYRPVRAMVWCTALLIGVGALLGGLNTMYAAFSARAREVGMLQSLGYSKGAVIVSFVQESVLSAGAGTVIGAGAGLLLLPGVAVKFSMGAFGLVVDERTLTIGLVSGLLLGIIGALPPAVRCLRMPIPEALKSA